jgi:hypothetical protein
VSTQSDPTDTRPDAEFVSLGKYAARRGPTGQQLYGCIQTVTGPLPGPRGGSL